MSSKLTTGATVSGAGDGAGSPGAPFRSVFEPGDKVEVRSDEEGFRGVWFEAEIVRRIRGRKRRCDSYSVNYVSIVSDEDHSQPQSEVVSRSNVRPRPPPPPPLVAGGEGCQLHDPVEAFQNDGWWFGIVSSVPLLPDAGPYTVCFPTCGEVIQFQHSDLRPQLHWVKNRWIPAKKMDHQNSMFHVGDQVEVSRHQKDYGEAWFDAVVIKVFGTSTFLVEYENLKIDNIEILSHDYIRPRLRPHVKDFVSGDEVEALLNCSWLPGTLLEVLDQGKCLIELEHSKQKLKFDCAEIRHQHVRRGRRWEFKNKRVQKLLDTDGSKSRKMKKMAGKSSSLPILLSDSSDEGDVVEHDPKGNKTLVESTKVNTSSKRLRAEATPSLCKSSKATLLDHNGSPRLDDNTASGLEIENHTPTPVVEDDFSMDNHCNSIDISNPLQIFSHDGSRHEARTPEGNSGHLQIEHCGGLLPIAKCSNSKGLLASQATTGKRRKRLVTCYPKRREIPIDVGLRVQPQNQITPEEGNDPPDKCTTDMRGSFQCKSENFEWSPDEVVGRSDKRQNDALNHNLLEGKSSKICKQKEVLQSSPLLLDSPSDLIGIAHPCAPFKSLSASDETNTSTIGKQVGDVQDACLTFNVESLVSNCTMINCSTSKPSSDVRSCSVKTKPIVASKCYISPSNSIISAANQTLALTHEDNSSMHEDLTQVRSPLKVITVENVRASFVPSPYPSSLEKVPLPFFKSSPMWKSIETMEAFRQLPQEPHFRPLEKHRMELREGMAIGLMISFANLVSMSLKLSISDNQTTIEEMLRALEELEANGFHVASLRMRLKELLEIQVIRTERESRKAMLEAKMLDMRNEIDKLDAKITFYDRIIGDLEEVIGIMHVSKDRYFATGRLHLS